MVFCGLFPIDSDDYPDLRDALEKLTLNDAALLWEPETSDALGFGFRCGFLGLLHMDIVRERLEREYDLELMATMPSVEFELTLTDGEVVTVHNPTDMPDPARIAETREPYVRASILTPKEYIGQIMELCQERRGEHTGMHYLSSERVQLHYDLPLSEIVLDFFDQLKSRTRGYASLDYEPLGLRASDLVKLDVLLAGDPVDALSMVVHRDKAYEFGKTLTEKLRKRIPRQQYDVPIQAAVGAKIIARETVKAFRKDVTAKCYGGDITRKRKLLEQQKEGKKRMKQVGRIEVPQDAFLAVLELGDERPVKTWGPVTYAVGREKIREYARAVGETNPLHLDLEAARAAGHARPRRAADVRRRLHVAGDRPGDARPRRRDGLRAHGPRRAGVHVGPARRGRRRDHDRGRARRRLRARRHGLLRVRVALGQPGRRARLHRHLDLHRERRLSMEVPELKVTPDRYLTVRYAGASGDFNPIHVDDEFARSVGLPGRILHGLWTMAQVARAQTEAAGGPDRLKRLSVQFRGMGVPEQEVVVTLEGARGRATASRSSTPRRARATRGSSAAARPSCDLS